MVNLCLIRGIIKVIQRLLNGYSVDPEYVAQSKCRFRDTRGTMPAVLSLITTAQQRHKGDRAFVSLNVR